VVYDCSDFAQEHPGGEAVIRRYAGRDCSLPFWRFHREDQLVKYGWALRVGRVAGVRTADPVLKPPAQTRMYGNTTFEYDNDW
jgi:cytochrome b involved in lipid metabolism